MNFLLKCNNMLCQKLNAGIWRYSDEYESQEEILGDFSETFVAQGTGSHAMCPAW